MELTHTVKLSKILVVITAIVGLLAMSLNGTVGAQESSFGVYSNFQSYRAAAMVVSDQGAQAGMMTEKAKDKRRTAIRNALDAVAVHDRGSDQMDEVARKYGLVIYNPNLREDGFMIMSDGSDVEEMPKPSIIYDSLLDEEMVNGSFEWSYAPAILKDNDWETGWVEGFDAAGLAFSDITDVTDITDVSFVTYDYNGTQRDDHENATDISQGSNGEVAIFFKGQDEVLGNNTGSGIYNWWEGHIWVSFDHFIDGDGNVQTYYSHDFKGTDITNQGWGIGVGADDKIVSFDLGYQIEFDNTTYKWGQDSQHTSY